MSLLDKFKKSAPVPPSPCAPRMASSSAPIGGSTFPPVERRTVLLPADQDFDDYVAYQRNFMDQRTGRLIPSTDVYIGERLHVRTNALGCKGENLVPGMPTIAFFGDSVMQGVDLDSFARHVHIPGMQVLNAAVEGAPLERAGDIHDELKGKTPLAALVVHGGWHNLMYNRSDEPFWIEQWARFDGAPVIAHMTLTGDINPEAIERGYGKFLDRPPAPTPAAYVASGYGPWLFTRQEFDDPIKLRSLALRIAAYNDALRRFCAERGRVVIDLDKVLAPRAYADIASRFFDMVHVRPAYYPAAGAEIQRQLAPHIPATSAFGGSRQGAKAPPPPAPSDSGAAATGMNYPLW